MQASTAIGGLNVLKTLAKRMRPRKRSSGLYQRVHAVLRHAYTWLFEIPSGSAPHGISLGRSTIDRPRPANQAAREFTNCDAPYFIVEALKGRGIPYYHVDHAEITRPAFRRREIISFELSGVTYYYDSHCRLSVADPNGESVPGPIIDGPAAYQVTQKSLTAAVLQQHSIRVPHNTTLPARARQKAALAFLALSPKAELGLCVKPNASSSGRNVHVGLKSLDAFQAAFEKTGKRHDHILIEETVPGVVYRFLCIAGRVVAVHFSIPASVTGDGAHSVSELIAIKNASRECFSIRIDLSARKLLEKAGRKLDDVPENGTVVSLGETSNFNLGADIVDATDDVHPSYVALAEKAVSAFPGLVLAGVDMTLEAPNSPAGENYHVLELNCCPGLWAHYNPHRGEARPVAEAIIDYLLRSGSPDHSRRDVVPAT